VPVVTTSSLDTDRLGSREISAVVGGAIRARRSIRPARPTRTSPDLVQLPGGDVEDEPTDRVLVQDERVGLDSRDRLADVLLRVRAIGAIVAVAAATVDLRSAIGFSSFGVLLYYALANASAWTLTHTENRPPRAIPAIGLLGCLLLAFTLPGPSILTGAAVIAVGAGIYSIRHALNGRHTNHPEET
jgi:hypothetical protein